VRRAVVVRENQLLSFGHRQISLFSLARSSASKMTWPDAPYTWFVVNSVSICWLNPFTKACSSGPGLARRGFAASTNVEMVRRIGADERASRCVDVAVRCRDSY
jgi:hypothetical protein